MKKRQAEEQAQARRRAEEEQARRRAEEEAFARRSAITHAAVCCTSCRPSAHGRVAYQLETYQFRENQKLSSQSGTLHCCYKGTPKNGPQCSTLLSIVPQATGCY